MNKHWLQLLATIVLPAADNLIETNAIPADQLGDFRKQRDAIAGVVKPGGSGSANADSNSLPDLTGFFSVLAARLMPAREVNATDAAVERAIALRQSRGDLFPKAQHLELCDAAHARGKAEGISEAETRLKSAHAQEIASVKRSESRRTRCAADKLPLPEETVLCMDDAGFEAARTEALKRVETLELASIPRNGKFAARFLWCSAEERDVLSEGLKPAAGRKSGDPLATGTASRGSGSGSGEGNAAESTPSNRNFF